MPTSEYSKGAWDAWEAARDIMLPCQRGGLNLNELTEVFGTKDMDDILSTLNPEDAINHIRDWRDKQGGLVVGDVVMRRGGRVGAITSIVRRNGEPIYSVLEYDGSWVDGVSRKYLIKMGKRVDIPGILAELEEIHERE